MVVDVALVGGGLANGLIAWRLLSARPEVSFVLIERDPVLGGNHTWSFHETDLEPPQHDWLMPLVSASWSGYDVAFPGLRREFVGRYHSIRSADFSARLRKDLGDRVWLSSNVGRLTPNRVELADGRFVEAGAVVDGRGFLPTGAAVGYQRFVGFDLELERPHGLARPVIMDATVPQAGGFRFVYLLPWSATAVLIEDTTYSDTPDLDVAGSKRAIDDYVAARGWRIATVVREERGALPIPLARSRDAEPEVATVGVRAGLFHPTTGYSLPHAVRVADRLSALRALTTASVRAAIAEERLTLEAGHRYLRRLNRMLFRAALPEDRYRILERFHRLPAPLIRRFYADRLTAWDRLRIVVGRPPVPIGKALACWGEPG